MSLELGSQRSTAELRASLRGPVPHAPAGPRSPQALLARLERIAPLVGVTQLLDVTHRARIRLPSFQAVRPDTFHRAAGQRAEPLGKNRRSRDAKIGALMEAIETASAEPAGARLLRGSYNFLRRQHPVVDPRQAFRVIGSRPVGSDQPLLWTPAYEWWTDCEVLIPAEMVFFPLASASYATRAVFPMSSVGTAAHRTYPSAALAGLFECLERMYLGMVDVGRAHLEALHEDEVTEFDFARWQSLADGRELQLYAVSLPGGPDLPMVVCLIVGDRDVCLGSACAGDPDSAVRKAIDEALVAFASLAHAEAEPAGVHTAGPARHFGFDLRRARLPQYRTLSMAGFRRRFRLDRDPRAQLAAAARVVRRMGFPILCFANLTRAGIDIPVVKTVVIGMPAEGLSNRSTAGALTLSDILAAKFHVDPSSRHRGEP